jgi:hypothetical protein
MESSYKALPSIQQLSELFSWDIEKGQLIWLVTRGSSIKGTRAGTISNCGYFITSIKGQRYLIHRIIWMLGSGSDPRGLQVDHINGNRLDNRFCNLRAAERLDNNKNVKAHDDNKSGHLGITEHKPGIWRARIMKNGKNMHLGLFPSIEQAVEARRKAELEYHGEFSSYASRSAPKVP